MAETLWRNNIFGCKNKGDTKDLPPKPFWQKCFAQKILAAKYKENAKVLQAKSFLAERVISPIRVFGCKIQRKYKGFTAKGFLAEKDSCAMMGFAGRRIALAG